ncbi:hypothetical protein H8959_005668 [Pygathrix nigripes]
MPGQRRPGTERGGPRAQRGCGAACGVRGGGLAQDPTRGDWALLVRSREAVGVDAWSYCKRRDQQEFVRALAAFLKKSGKLKVPEWVDTVKLAKHKELAPYDENWFYTRAGTNQTALSSRPRQDM